MDKSIDIPEHGRAAPMKCMTAYDLRFAPSSRPTVQDKAEVGAGHVGVVQDHRAAGVPVSASWPAKYF